MIANCEPPVKTSTDSAQVCSTDRPPAVLNAPNDSPYAPLATAMDRPIRDSRPRTSVQPVPDAVVTARRAPSAAGSGQHHVAVAPQVEAPGRSVGGPPGALEEGAQVGLAVGEPGVEVRHAVDAGEVRGRVDQPAAVPVSRLGGVDAQCQELAVERGNRVRVGCRCQGREPDDPLAGECCQHPVAWGRRVGGGGGPLLGGLGRPDGAEHVLGQVAVRGAPDGGLDPGDLRGVRARRGSHARISHAADHPTQGAAVPERSVDHCTAVTIRPPTANRSQVRTSSPARSVVTRLW